MAVISLCEELRSKKPNVQLSLEELLSLVRHGYSNVARLQLLSRSNGHFLPTRTVEALVNAFQHAGQSDQLPLPAAPLPGWDSDLRGIQGELFFPQNAQLCGKPLPPPPLDISHLLSLPAHLRPQPRDLFKQRQLHDSSLSPSLPVIEGRFFSWPPLAEPAGTSVP